MNPIVINKVRFRFTRDQYYQESFPKRQLYIHHTVGGSAESTFNWWLKDPNRIGTAYIIDRDGTIYEIFDPRYWAHHLGLQHKRNMELNQYSIGIELASEGALTKRDGKYYAFDGKQVYRQEPIDNQVEWRGYRYFDLYETAQIDSLYSLVKYLCEQHSIPKKCVDKKESTLFSEKFFDFNGVLGHCNVRADKTDPHPQFRFQNLQGYLDGAERGEVIPS